jgi:hypothetical protein
MLSRFPGVRCLAPPKESQSGCVLRGIAALTSSAGDVEEAAVGDRPTRAFVPLSFF